MPGSAGGDQGPLTHIRVITVKYSISIFSIRKQFSKADQNNNLVSVFPTDPVQKPANSKVNLQFVSETLLSVSKVLSAILDEVAEVLSAILHEVAEVLSAILDEVAEVLSAILDEVAEVLSAILDEVAEVLSAMPD